MSYIVVRVRRTISNLVSCSVLNWSLCVTSTFLALVIQVGVVFRYLLLFTRKQKSLSLYGYDEKTHLNVDSGMRKVIAIILDTLNWSLHLSSESLSRSAILTVAEKEEFVSLLGHSLNIHASAAGLANVCRLLFTLSWETMSTICL